MSIVQDGIKEEIQKLRDEQAAENDARKVLSKLAASAKDVAESSILKANQTNSIDERIKYLLNALQSMLTDTEEALENTQRGFENYDTRINALEDILDKVESLEAEEKKSN